MSQKRAEIIQTARQLFSQHGFCATGVDKIMAEAGISKRTMYRYFPTKNDLIDVVVEQYVQEVQDFWHGVEQAGAPREQILTLFRAVQGALGSPGLQGCLTVRAMAEFGGTELAVEARCKAFKRWELAAFEQMVARLGAPDPARVALRLLLIYEGMFAYTQVLRTAPPDEVIDWVAEILDTASREPLHR